MRVILCLAGLLSLAAPLTQAPPPAATATARRAPTQDGSKVWIGRYAEFEEFIRSARIERIKDIGLGVTHPRHAYFAPGGLAGGIVVKLIPPGRRLGYWESYKAEIAAYKMDRVLALDMVPPTVERIVDDEPVSAQLWVDDTRNIKDVKDAAPDVLRWNRQVFRQRVFDDLIGNIDENAGNILIDPAWNMILIDHSRCFTDVKKLPFAVDQLKQIDRPVFDRIKGLDRDTLVREIGVLVGNEGIKGVLQRRDDIVKWFEDLAAKRGEAAVFTP
jgi:hypothetical protein